MADARRPRARETALDARAGKSFHQVTTMNRRNFLGLFVILPGAGRIWRAVLDPSPVDQFMFGVPSDGNIPFSELPEFQCRMVDDQRTYRLRSTIHTVEFDLPEITKILHSIHRKRIESGIPLVEDVHPMSLHELESRRQFFRRHLGQFLRP